MERHVFVENVGCLVCDVCHHKLLDSTEELQSRMYVLRAETDNINAALLRNRAFFHFTNEVDELQKEINHYKLVINVFVCSLRIHLALHSAMISPMRNPTRRDHSQGNCENYRK